MIVNVIVNVCIVRVVHSDCRLVDSMLDRAFSASPHVVEYSLYIPIVVELVAVGFLGVSRVFLWVTGSRQEADFV